MGGFTEHYSDHAVVYPATTLFVGLSVYGLTGRELVMLASVAVGYVFLVVGLLAPDIDHPNSIIHRTVDRLFAILLAGLVGYWVLASDIGAAVGLVIDPVVLLGGVPDWVILVSLVGLLLVWKAYNAPHRGLPHQPRWAVALAALVTAGIWVGLPEWRVIDRLAMGGSLAVHFLVGTFAHLDRDGILFGEGPSFRAEPGDGEE